MWYVPLAVVAVEILPLVGEDQERRPPKLVVQWRQAKLAEVGWRQQRLRAEGERDPRSRHSLEGGGHVASHRPVTQWTVEATDGGPGSGRLVGWLRGCL